MAITRSPAFESIVRELPKHFSEGIRLGTHALASKPRAVLICAMGGSALAGHILKNMAEQGLLSLPVTVWRNYGIPPKIPPRSLVILVSYSGNTEETLSAYESAGKKKLPRLAISSGGTLERLARASGVPHIRIPPGIPPRLSAGYMLGALAGVLHEDRALRAALKKTYAKEEGVGRRFARALRGKIPLIYAPAEWDSLAHFWKITFNENSKLPAFSYTVPEISHNEMLGLAGKPPFANKNFSALFLDDPEGHPRVRKRIRLTMPILRHAHIKTVHVPLRGKTFFEKLLSNIALAYWTSYYVALDRGANPMDEALIEKFKLKMKKGR